VTGPDSPADPGQRPASRRACARRGRPGGLSWSLGPGPGPGGWRPSGLVSWARPRRGRGHRRSRDVGRRGGCGGTSRDLAGAIRRPDAAGAGPGRLAGQHRPGAAVRLGRAGVRGPRGGGSRRGRQAGELAAVAQLVSRSAARTSAPGDAATCGLIRSRRLPRRRCRWRWSCPSRRRGGWADLGVTLAWRLAATRRGASRRADRPVPPRLFAEATSPLGEGGRAPRGGGVPARPRRADPGAAARGAAPRRPAG